MKKLVSLLLALSMALTLAACNGSRGKGAASGSDLTQKQIDRIVEKQLKEEAKAQNNNG